MSLVTINRRTLVLGCCAVAATTGAAIVASASLRRRNAAIGDGPSKVASLDFSLTTPSGTPFSGEELKGRPFLVFFGFTNCPEICPTTLYELSMRLKEMGPDANVITPLFISVDPERDTGKVLERYMASFDPRIVALRGTAEEIDKAVASFGAYFKKFRIDDDYTVDHTAVVLLYDERARLRGTLDTHETAESQRQKLDRLAAG